MIGSRLKAVRRQHKERREDLAGKLGMSKYAIDSWERGIAEPKDRDLVRICEMYNVSADYLLGLTDEMSPPSQISRDGGEIQLNLYGINEKSRQALQEYVSFLRWKEKGISSD